MREKLSPEELQARKKQRDRDYYQRNRRKIIDRATQYYYDNQEEVKERIREHDKQKRANRRAQAVEKLGGCCQDCGNEDIRVLQFHHRDPETKLFEITAAGTRKEEAFWAEVEKCDLVCANCHLIRHCDAQAI